MAGFPLMPLPAYNPGNALNFSPVNNAIDSNRQNALAQQQMGLQQQRNALMVKQDDRAAEMHGVQMAQARTQQGLQEARQAAGVVQHIQGLPPDQQAAAWQHALTQPGFKDLPPDLHDFARAAPMILGKAAEYMSPMDRAKMGLVNAQADKARREAVEGSAEKFGNTPIPIENPDGSFSIGQVSSRGNFKSHPLDRGVRPARGIMQIGDEAVRKADASVVRSVGDAIAGGEVAKGRGEHVVKLEASMPKSRASMESANAKAEIVRSKIQQAIPMVSNWSVGPGSYLSTLPATQARNLKEIANTIIANMGFDELQEMRTNSPTGGALGQVAVQELEMLQKTKTSLDQAQTVDQYLRALGELKSFYDGAATRRQRAFDETYAPLSRRTGNSPLVSGPSVPRQFGNRLPQADPAPTSQGMIPPQAVQFLRGNPSPEIIQQFEAKYGPGSARQFMGGQ